MKLIKHFLVTLLIGFTTTSCSHKEPEISFVVPDNFRGEVQVWQDFQTGQSVIQDGSKFVVNVPNNGKVKLKDTSFFYQWHDTSLRLASSNTVSRSDTPPVSKNEVKLFAIGTSSGQNNIEILLFFVGTESEFFAYKKKP